MQRKNSKILTTALEANIYRVMFSWLYSFIYTIIKRALFVKNKARNCFSFFFSDSDAVNVYLLDVAFLAQVRSMVHIHSQSLMHSRAFQ